MRAEPHASLSEHRHTPTALPRASLLGEGRKEAAGSEPMPGCWILGLAGTGSPLPPMWGLACSIFKGGVTGPPPHVARSNCGC